MYKVFSQNSGSGSRGPVALADDGKVNALGQRDRKKNDLSKCVNDNYCINTFHWHGCMRYA